MDAYQHILLAADFYGQGQALAAKARRLAQLCAARLSLLHVIDDIPMPDTHYGAVIATGEDSGDPLLEAEKAKFKRLGQQAGVAVADQWLVWGLPKEEIANFASQQAVDLIIVGRHPRHGLAWLLGATAHGVLHRVGCDVLAIRLD